MLKQRVSLPLFKFSERLEKAQYSLGAEDSTVEESLVKQHDLKRIMSLGGSGTRCFSLFTHELEALSFLTDEDEQIWMWKLWYRSLEVCQYNDFLFFWGLPPFNEKKMGKRRKKIFKSLELDLSLIHI